MFPACFRRRKSQGMSDTRPAEATRRDFLYITTAAVGSVGAAAAVWPLIDQMNPDASVLALATVEVDLERPSPRARASP